MKQFCKNGKVFEITGNNVDTAGRLHPQNNINCT